MEEEFYAVIKLVSGEEIFSKVCPCDEENRIILILEDPITIEKIKIRETQIPIVRVNPWIEMSEDSMFIIDMENVIMISESTDDELISVHKRYVKTKYKKTGKSTVSQQKGYVSSISDARERFEKIYRSNKL